MQTFAFSVLKRALFGQNPALHENFFVSGQVQICISKIRKLALQNQYLNLVKQRVEEREGPGKRKGVGGCGLTIHKLMKWSLSYERTDRKV